ncbi:hypothetical protein Q0F99_11490 [Rathayibacter oskolensis]|uniref:hypothetical protein n=1 Tax=Rathayibacter TaxID=33886 RepID=UPI001318D0D2|nr:MULTISPECIES: hypothetical protein [Rathayibacter]QHC65662.1 hypothetical protein GSU68_03085 [Rathayibacter sp. VKM Ac-2759]WKK70488.1 hypothetical protein Q0F99_11490 [Rathayibacter oskolensis]
MTTSSTPSTVSSAPIPGRTLGIIAVVVAVFFNVIGLILGIVALVQSRRAGYRNGPAVAAIIVGAIFTVAAIIATIAIVTVAGFSAEAYQACQAVDFSGTVTVGGREVACSTINP